MLRIGLTGGIGAGKSTVSRMLADAGAVIIDADVIAREVVAPGQPLLTRLAEAFGPEVIASDGSLDRPALAGAAFSSPESTARLNGLMHPAIRTRTAELFAEHADAEVVVHDVPLLVENGMSPEYHLCILVDVPAPVRLSRLVESRGMDRADAEARIARQADDSQRYAACDVIIDNSGNEDATRAQVSSLLTDRLTPFARNLTAGRIAAMPDPIPVIDAAGANWPQQAERIAARIRRALGQGTEVTHIGPTADGRDRAADIMDLSVVPRAGDDAGADVAERMSALGFPPIRVSSVGDSMHGSCDPGRLLRISVRTD